MFELLTHEHLTVFSKEIDNKIINSITDLQWGKSVYTSWLKESSAKRYITYKMYQEYFEDCLSNYTILDIGGGITPLTSFFIKYFKRYDLCEIFAHDKQYLSFFDKKGQLFDFDWYDISTASKQWDLVIANDLFPNVDQRMELFIEKFLPHCKKIRFIVTFYNEPRFYQTKRIGAEEILTYLAYNGQICFEILSHYKDRITNFDLNAKQFFTVSPCQSLFPNKRHVVLVEIKGDL